MADPIILQWAPAPPLLVLQWATPDRALPPLSPDAPLPTVITVVGPQGGRGPAGGEAFEHIQSSPSAEWIVNHNLGFRPSVTVLSPGGVEVGANPVHQSTNQLRIYFAAPQSGTAHCI
ncbi:MAG: hypothetical protein JHC81_04940 [Brevundimonas sp.]|uniref:hypothetical protein n=1 Tax=Brevundimonas sp. TaxID=1871086 RepID=UPI001A24F6C0|nr:hypothetical protein [Brevundimonas sp.]MBJ7446861.1 hypothetical protein [Brevundimonas sp.]